MATKLKNMRLTSVDLVRSGANQEADICLYKSADPTEAHGAPTERETNIFKRFLSWLKENPTEVENEPENPIEKAYDQPDTADIYKSAITESLQSIMEDEGLTSAEKSEMLAKSISEYHEAMVQLLGGNDVEKSDIEAEDDDLGDDYDDGVEKSFQFDEIVELQDLEY